MPGSVGERLRVHVGKGDRFGERREPLLRTRRAWLDIGRGTSDAAFGALERENVDPERRVRGVWSARLNRPADLIGNPQISTSLPLSSNSQAALPRPRSSPSRWSSRWWPGPRQSRRRLATPRRPPMRRRRLRDRRSVARVSELHCRAYAGKVRSGFPSLLIAQVISTSWRGTVDALPFRSVPFRVARSLSGESAAVVAQMPLKIPSLHEATLSVTDSLPSAGAPPASSSSGVSRTSSASMTFARASSRVLPSLIAPEPRLPARPTSHHQRPPSESSDGGRCSCHKGSRLVRSLSEPTPGLEPGTPSLRMKCSTN
jgi:hypothetical protein